MSSSSFRCFASNSVEAAPCSSRAARSSSSQAARRLSRSISNSRSRSSNLCRCSSPSRASSLSKTRLAASTLIFSAVSHSAKSCSMRRIRTAASASSVNLVFSSSSPRSTRTRPACVRSAPKNHSSSSRICASALETSSRRALPLSVNFFVMESCAARSHRRARAVDAAESRKTLFENCSSFLSSSFFDSSSAAPAIFFLPPPSSFRFRIFSA
mmetsp:Transcript_13649/g.41252  ORF Transcript_13649/g.41252 Transcript_13649/m.41252 type:complete len:213 (-) Transcript_13649:52-690(-)